jgi:hypothetical protein
MKYQSKHLIIKIICDKLYIHNLYNDIIKSIISTLYLILSNNVNVNLILYINNIRNNF